MKVKRVLFLTLVGVISLIMSVFGVGFKLTNKTAVASSEVTGFDINGEFMVLGENATSIKYATTDEFVLAEEPSTVAIDDQTMYVWLANTTIYYYAGDDVASMIIMLPVDVSFMFNSLQKVETIDLSGFMFAENSNVESMFAGCSSLKEIDMSDVIVDSSKTNLIFDDCSALSEITLGSDSECLFTEAKTLWNNAPVYNKATGVEVSQVPEITAGQKLTITNVAPVKTYFDLRDGNGLVESNANGFSYNPEKAGFEFAGWSKVIDDITASNLIDKTSGENASIYDAGDFATGVNYYAVWKVANKVVITQELDLTSASSIDKTASHGYEWNSDTKTLTISGLNIANNNANENGIILPDGAKLVIASDSENNVSAQKNAISCADLEVKLGSSGTGILNLSGTKAIISSGNVNFVGGKIVSQNAVDISGKLTLSGAELNVVCINETPITVGSMEINKGKFVAESQWQAAVLSTGNVIVNGGSVKLSSGVDSNCIKSSGGNIVISGGELEMTATGTAALSATQITFENFATLKTGETKASSAEAEEYDGEAYVFVKFHNFEITVDGNKIIATCQNESCELENKKVELEVSIENKTYDGTANAVLVTNKETFESVLNKTLEIKYVGILSTEYEESSVAPTNVGDYQVTVAVNFGGMIHQVIKTFKIEEDSVSVTAPTTLNLTFNGEAQALINAGSVSGGGVLKYKLESGEYSTNIPTATNAGEYKVYYKFFGDANHADSAEEFITVTIAPKTIEIIWQENEFVYNGNVQTITAKYKDVANTDVTLSVSVNQVFKNAGSYIATASFAEADNNYKLPAETTKSYTIAKAKVQKPVADTTKYIYNGEEQTYQIANSDYYQVAGNNRTDAGVYDVKVSLIDKTNYEWTDSTIGDLSFEFVINRATMIGAKDKLGNGVSEVEIKSAAGGIHPNAVFEVELIKSNDISSLNVLENVLKNNGKLSATQKVYYGVNLTLKIEGIATQPNGKVVLNVKIPEVLKAKTYDIFHIHTNADGSKEIVKIAYTQSETAGYISIELDKFSEIAFVVDEPPIETFPVHWVFIGISGLFVVLFLIWFFVLKKNKYDMVSKIVVSLFEGVGVVMLCMFRSSNMLGYAIFNLVMFVAVDLFYMINTSKEKQPEKEKIET